ncbi:ribosome biogenesis GTP-binding protein YihA/YsxC [Granulosicoccaceae sp. 1_MG-2023]|nr:ribosome biogenesis GTP-binding protein YihA/YsxC [Granulosicoccaceae sp. 1_MG-2023]
MNPLYFRTTFSTSANAISQLPDDSLSEVAFAGRSNAGKSSAINTITRNGKLARTSKTPGRTQLINFFPVMPEHYLVDLPGYGYAKVSRSQQQHWQKVLGDYLITREQLRCLVLVMDIRHPLTDHDWRMIEFQQAGAGELHLLLTKADKISRNAAKKTLFATQAELERNGIEATLQLFSAHNNEGVDDAHSVLDMYLFGADTEEHEDDDPAL